MENLLIIRPIITIMSSSIQKSRENETRACVVTTPLPLSVTAGITSSSFEATGKLFHLEFVLQG